VNAAVLEPAPMANPVKAKVPAERRPPSNPTSRPPNHEQANMIVRELEPGSHRLFDMVASKIEFDRPTEEELIDLNYRIVERLHFLHRARAHSRMLEFSVGDRVSFEAEGREPLLSVLILDTTRRRRLLSPTKVDDGTSHRALRKVKDVRAPFGGPNVVELRKK
jgi:hypothetical protein